MKQLLTLSETLHHPGFSWPESLVFLPAEKPESLAFHLTDAQGGEYAAQWVESEKKIALVTALDCAEEKRFTVQPGSAARTMRCGGEDGFWADNGAVRLEIGRAAGALFTLRMAGTEIAGTARLNVPVLEKRVTVLQAGDVFAEVAVEALCADEKRYRVTLRLALNMEFAEMLEEIDGFAKEDAAAMTLDWQGFSPVRRCNHYRGMEYIDQYLEADGRVPTLVAPYDSWVSWWQDKTVSFADEENSVGVFIRRAEKWDDHEYSLWRSSDTLAVRFYCRGEKLQFYYPLADGTRGSAVAFFANAEDLANCSAKSDGLVKQDTVSHQRLTHIEELWYWQEYIALDKVKDWVLRWDEDRSAFPRFFTDDRLPPDGFELWYLGRVRELTPAMVEKVVYELSHSLNELARTGAVSNREFYDWAVLFDRTIPQMTEKQYGDLRAAFAFCAYAFSDENYMPIRKMLAGHPNFLMDARGVAGVAAALFPHHPQADVWRHEFELAVARNLKYHTRPDVKAWNALGGRWTENQGCYVLAMLRPLSQAQYLLHETYGDYVALYPSLSKLWSFLVGSLSAPIGGVRRFPSLGAHSAARPVNNYQLLQWGDALFNYDPLLAEALYSLGDKKRGGFEEQGAGTSHYRPLANRPEAETHGTRPQLESAKYTGYGYVLRSETYDPEEMTVELIQIDEGPNYRWGIAGSGGCGSLCYYAADKNWGAQRPEDMGDWNKGDAQACCNFGVLIGNEYRSVGRNELTEPLYDFGFAQYARVNANEKVSAFYRYRSVIMSGNDYITVYDAVTDMHVRGRFSWFNEGKGNLPAIVQLKPGAQGVETDGGVPIDVPYRKPDETFCGRYYEGDGDFLTYVSHRSTNADRGAYTTATDYGVMVEMQGRTDYVFHRAAKIRYSSPEAHFTGHAGIVRVYGKTKAQAALFDGSEIGVWGVRAECENAGIGFTVENRQLSGIIEARENAMIALHADFPCTGYKLYLNGEPAEFIRTEDGARFAVPTGRAAFEWTVLDAKPLPPRIVSVLARDGGADVFWEGRAERYRPEISLDGAKTWRALEETARTNCTIRGLKNGKLHVRVRGVNGGREGDSCWEYPVYLTDKPAQAPDGLRVVRSDEGYTITWGQVLGAAEYCLYRLTAQGRELVYRGAERRWNAPAEDAAYCVSAVNGNGEGEPSPVRSTCADGLERWDPKPEEKFRRYCTSHEYGYAFYDFWHDYLNRKTKEYPD